MVVAIALVMTVRMLTVKGAGGYITVFLYRMVVAASSGVLVMVMSGRW